MMQRAIFHSARTQFELMKDELKNGLMNEKSSKELQVCRLFNVVTGLVRKLVLRNQRYRTVFPSFKPFPTSFILTKQQHQGTTS